MAGTPQAETIADSTEPQSDGEGAQNTGLTSQYLDLTRPPSTRSDRIQVAQVGSDLAGITGTSATSTVRQEKLNEFGSYTYKQESGRSVLTFEGSRRDFNFSLSRSGGVVKDLELQEKGQSDKLKFVPQFDSKARDGLFYAANREVKDFGLNSKFLADMIRFENRAKEAGLTPQQVSETYLNLQRILSPGRKDLHGVTAENRVLLAQQLMAQIAEPKLATQAAVTCAPTVAEILLNARHPEKSSKFIADLLINGKFQAANGTIVNLDKDAFTPLLFENRNPPSDGDRSLLTKVFTAHSLDLILNQQQKNQVYKESYENGAFKFKLQSTNPSLSKSEEYKGLASDHTGMIYNMISSRDAGKEMISLGYSDKPVSRTETFNTFEQFQDALKRVAQTKSLPIGLGVNIGIPPVWNGRDEITSAGGHILVVSKISLGNDGNPEQITIYNQGAVVGNQYKTLSARELFGQTSREAFMKSALDTAKASHPDWNETQLKFASLEKLYSNTNFKPYGSELFSLMREIIASAPEIQPGLLSNHERIYQSMPAQEKLDYLYFQGPYGPDQGKFVERLGTLIKENNISPAEIKNALENFDFNKELPASLPIHAARAIKRALLSADPELRKHLDKFLGQ